MGSLVPSNVELLFKGRLPSQDPRRDLFFFYFRENEEGREGMAGWGNRERNIHFLFHFFMHSLVDFSMCPDRGSNRQPWYIGGDTLTELPSQG